MPVQAPEVIFRHTFSGPIYPVRHAGTNFYSGCTSSNPLYIASSLIPLRAYTCYDFSSIMAVRNSTKILLSRAYIRTRGVQAECARVCPSVGAAASVLRVNNQRVRRGPGTSTRHLRESTCDCLNYTLRRSEPLKWRARTTKALYVYSECADIAVATTSSTIVWSSALMEILTSIYVSE